MQYTNTSVWSLISSVFLESKIMNKLSLEIDHINYQFIAGVKSQLANLEQFSLAALDFLMMEHYQFSQRNTKFLANAETCTRKLNNPGVAEELQRNFKEEEHHAAIYKKALYEIDTDVVQRKEFLPTTAFFQTIAQLISGSASITLGAMYATETAAIFEHEVFRDISYAVISRREKPWPQSRLKHFHDMHLSGVEQGHKDGLGNFVDMAQAKDFQDIIAEEIRQGALQAIEAMRRWWQALLKQAQQMS